MLPFNNLHFCTCNLFSWSLFIFCACPCIIQTISMKTSYLWILKFVPPFLLLLYLSLIFWGFQVFHLSLLKLKSFVILSNFLWPWNYHICISIIFIWFFLFHSCWRLFSLTSNFKTISFPTMLALLTQEFYDLTEMFITSLLLKHMEA
jgi:hypothetical protein